MPVYQPQLAYSPVQAGRPDMKFGQSVTAPDLDPIILHLDHTSKVLIHLFRDEIDTDDCTARILRSRTRRGLATACSRGSGRNGLPRVTSSMSIS